ncbi:Hypothetical protein A7982_10150 [Minicystis rosea]|nr:Hypothetical protein A7982_10150 [Minicystis rosea]
MLTRRVNGSLSGTEIELQRRARVSTVATEALNRSGSRHFIPRSSKRLEQAVSLSVRARLHVSCASLHAFMRAKVASPKDRRAEVGAPLGQGAHVVTGGRAGSPSWSSVEIARMSSCQPGKAAEHGHDNLCRNKDRTHFLSGKTQDHGLAHALLFP